MREQLVAIIEQVKPRFDRILLDTGAGISDVVLHAVSLADEVLVVVTPEPTSMTDAYATIKVLATLQGRRHIRLVVNQVSAQGEGRTIRNQLQLVVDRFVRPQLLNNGVTEALTLELLGEIPTDVAVREAVQRRHLLLVSMPGSPAAQAITAVATKLGELIGSARSSTITAPCPPSAGRA